VQGGANNLERREVTNAVVLGVNKIETRDKTTTYHWLKGRGKIMTEPRSQALLVEERKLTWSHKE